MRPIPPTNIRTYIAAVINYLPVSESQFTWTIRRLRVRLDVTVFAIPCATLLNFFVSVYFWVIFIRKPRNGSMYRNCVFSNIFISFRFVCAMINWIRWSVRKSELTWPSKGIHFVYKMPYQFLHFPLYSIMFRMVKGGICTRKKWGKIIKLWSFIWISSNGK